jgi:hypothetical protein
MDQTSEFMVPCQYPLFSSRFFGAQLWSSGNHNIDDSHDDGVKPLELKTISSQDGPLSETQLRRQKYRFYERHCSKIEDGLYISGDQVARSRAILLQNGITHIVNCVGFICKEYFQEEFAYKTYYLLGIQLRLLACLSASLVDMQP